VRLKEKGNPEETLAFQIRACGWPKPERNFRFLDGRKYELDFAWPTLKLGVEVQGGIFRIRSGHRSIRGLLRDYEKANLAQLNGWIFLQFSAKEIRSGEAVTLIQDAIEFRTEQSCSPARN